MPDPIEEVRKELREYLSRHTDWKPGEAYEFNIKMGIADVPDAVRKSLGEDGLHDVVNQMAQRRLGEFSDYLEGEYPWIDTMVQEGRSGGWFVIYPKEAVTEDELEWEFDPDDLELQKKQRQRVRDLRKIEQEVRVAVVGFQSDLGDLAWWHEVTEDPRFSVKSWNPRKPGEA